MSEVFSLNTYQSYLGVAERAGCLAAEVASGRQGPLVHALHVELVPAREHAEHVSRLVVAETHAARGPRGAALLQEKVDQLALLNRAARGGSPGPLQASL